jgi:hypothetical protein
MTPSGLIFVFVFLVTSAGLAQPQARGAGPGYNSISRLLHPPSRTPHVDLSGLYCPLIADRLASSSNRKQHLADFFIASARSRLWRNR